MICFLLTWSASVDSGGPSGLMMKMEDIMMKRLGESKDKVIKVILKSNGWKYRGRLVNFDEKYIEILDFVSNNFKIILVDDVSDLEVEE